MLLAEIIIALLLSLALTVILIAVFRRQPPGAKGYWSSLLFLFLLLFIANWAGGVWIRPFGPSAWGVFWLPFLVAGIIAALLLVFVLPGRQPHTSEEALQQAEIKAGAPGIFRVILWILMVALSISIIAHYAGATK